LEDEDLEEEALPDRRDPWNDRQRRALDAVLEERRYQKSRWPNDHLHTPSDWVSILTVWLGKLASEAPPYRGTDDPKALEAFRKRLTQLTAIGLAAREVLEP
jgi:hypothetical protein